MKIVLVRHGESEGNVKHEINDEPRRIVNLTVKGRAQAEATAKLLREIGFVHAYVSEFPRAQQTAAILLRYHDLPLHIDVRLNERRSGMDGLPVHVFNDEADKDYLHYKPEHGESFLEQMARLRSFLDEIAARHPYGMVLAVSHENPIVAATALQAERPELVMRNSVMNCGLVELEWPTPEAAPH
jgi:broad specificity phosphatase PhoE